jgi:hypothetical protein
MDGVVSCLEESGTDLMSPAASLLSLAVGQAREKVRCGGRERRRESPRKSWTASYQGKKIVGWKESLLI